MHPGETVTDHLRLVRKLGEGGMGSVWVADHLKLETQVAVKFVSLELLGHPEAKTRFQREATSAAKIHSPHVVRVFDHGQTRDGVPYIAMELLSGQDLGALIEQQGALPVAFVATVLAQACKGLGKAHELGIVHRDIKPENIFVTDEGGEPFVRVLDFGVAKQTLNAGLGLTSSGTMMGTPYYMSPEQAMSARQVDFRSDLWSLGVVVYHALTGVRPFDAETLGALCVRLHTGEFEPITRARSDLPPSFDAWFARALAREPQDRFGSAREMSDAFAQAAASAPPAEGLIRTIAVMSSRAAPSAVGARSLNGSDVAPSPADTMGQATAILQKSFVKRPSGWLWFSAGLVILGVVAALSLWVRSTAAPSAAASAPQPIAASGISQSTATAPASLAVAAGVSPAPSTAAPTASALTIVPAQSAVPDPSQQPTPAVARGARAVVVAPIKPTQTNSTQTTPVAPTAVPAHTPSTGANVAAPATPVNPVVERPTKKDRGF